jgi:hypothetical protein
VLPRPDSFPSLSFSWHVEDNCYASQCNCGAYNVEAVRGNAFISNCTCSEKEEWKPFRNALDKSDRKKFEEMSDIPRLYVSACSNSCQLVPLHPIVLLILFHHYKELKECINQVEQIEAKSTTTTSYRSNLFEENMRVIENGTLRVQFDYNFTEGSEVNNTATTLKNHTT